jgi:hypothetical protein
MSNSNIEKALAIGTLAALPLAAKATQTLLGVGSFADADYNSNTKTTLVAWTKQEPGVLSISCATDGKNSTAPQQLSWTSWNPAVAQVGKNGFVVSGPGSDGHAHAQRFSSTCQSTSDVLNMFASNNTKSYVKSSSLPGNPEQFSVSIGSSRFQPGEATRLMTMDSNTMNLVTNPISIGSADQELWDVDYQDDGKALVSVGKPTGGSSARDISKYDVTSGQVLCHSNPRTVTDGSRPQVAALPNGYFVEAHQVYGGPDGVLLDLYGPDCKPIGSQITVSSGAENRGDRNQYLPPLRVTSSGNIVGVSYINTVGGASGSTDQIFSRFYKFENNALHQIGSDKAPLDNSKVGIARSISLYPKSMCDFNGGVCEDGRVWLAEDKLAEMSYPHIPTVFAQKGMPLKDVKLPAATAEAGVYSEQLVGTLPSGVTYDAKTRSLVGTPVGDPGHTTLTLIGVDNCGNQANGTFPFVLDYSKPSVALRVVNNQPVVANAESAAFGPVKFLNATIPSSLSCLHFKDGEFSSTCVLNNVGNKGTVTTYTQDQAAVNGYSLPVTVGLRPAVLVNPDDNTKYLTPGQSFNLDVNTLFKQEDGLKPVYDVRWDANNNPMNLTFNGNNGTLSGFAPEGIVDENVFLTANNVFNNQTSTASRNETLTTNSRPLPPANDLWKYIVGGSAGAAFLVGIIATGCILHKRYKDRQGSDVDRSSPLRCCGGCGRKADYTSLNDGDNNPVVSDGEGKKDDDVLPRSDQASSTSSATSTNNSDNARPANAGSTTNTSGVTL